MKKIFLLIFLLCSLVGRSQVGANKLVTNLINNIVTTYSAIPISDTIPFTAANPAAYMVIAHAAHNFLFTSPASFRTQPNWAQVVVEIHGDSVHSINIDTTIATGFNVSGPINPDSLHDYKLVFNWGNNGFVTLGQQPTCTVIPYPTWPPPLQKYWSDSLNVANNVATITNSDGAISFGSSAAFSIGGWIFLNNGSTNHDMIFKQDGSNFPYYLIVLSSGITEFYIGDSLTHFIKLDASSNVLGTGGWHHIVGTYNGNGDTSGMKLYIDGAVVVPGETKSGTLAATDHAGTITIGLTTNAGFQTDQDFWVNAALSAGQVSAIYNGGGHMDVGSAGLGAALVAWIPMINQTFADFTGNGHNGSATTPLFSKNYK